MAKNWMQLSLALILTIVSMSVPSEAKEIDYGMSCLEQTEMKSYLGRAFNEARIAEGSLENGHRFEIYAGRSGSWTMVELPGDGYGCIHSYGHGLRFEPDLQGHRPAS